MHVANAKTTACFGKIYGACGPEGFFSKNRVKQLSPNFGPLPSKNATSVNQIKPPLKPQYSGAACLRSMQKQSLDSVKFVALQNFFLITTSKQVGNERLHLSRF